MVFSFQCVKSPKLKDLNAYLANTKGFSKYCASLVLKPKNFLEGSCVVVELAG